MTKIMKNSEFGELVQVVVDDHEMTYINAVLQVCEDNGFDPADVGGLIPKYIQDKIEKEAIDLRMLKAYDTVNIIEEFGDTDVTTGP